MQEYLKKIMKNNNIDDIYLIGFVDIEGKKAQFYHDLRFVYLEINSKYIEFESIYQFSKLKIRIIDLIEQNIEIDDGTIWGKTSVNEIILNDTMAKANVVDTIIFYNLDEQEELVCDAIALNLINGQTIFLDPSYWFGINIGGKEQKQLWKDNLKKNTKPSEVYLKISD